MTDGPEAGRWRRLEDLWDAAASLPSDRRAAFLETAASDDPDLRGELESMLADHAAAERFFRRMSEVVSSVVPDNGMNATDGLTGTTIGPYHVEGRLGAGGMGIVYRARDPRLDRVVALKLLPPHLSLDERARRRFFAEACAAAAIDHPNICTIYEVGETPEPRPFLAMAFYAGETLDRLLVRGPLPLDEVVDLGTQIARGLAAAHARGVTHRDIKPGNIMITADGVAKILDFGLATLPDATTTRGDHTLGTVAYMSPERARGQHADHRTDLWSLGVVLYEMVTGRRPFEGDSEVGVLYAIAHETHVSPSLLRPDLPEALECVIEGLLAKDPADRYPDAAAVLEALDAWDAGSPPRRPTGRLRAGRGRRRRWAYGIAVVGIAVGATTLRSVLGTGPGAPRVAVIGHDDTPAADGLGWLPGELAGTGISRLGQVPGIEVLSTNVLRPWRDAGLSDREIADQAGADWLVTASVRRAGTHVVASVALFDETETGPILRREPSRPLGEEGALIDDVARVASAMVRERLLAELQTGRRTWGDRSPEALRLVNVALGEIDEADRRIEGPDVATAWPFLRSAGATLERAAQADPGWAEPLVRGARLADRTAKYAFGTRQSRDSVQAALDRGVRYATRALGLGGDSARALEARGILRHTATILLPPLDPARRAALLDSAEQDLRAALRRDRGLPLALKALGSIESATGRHAAGLITMEDAYLADRYEQPIEKLTNLFEAWFDAGQDGRAAAKCAEIGSRFPTLWLVARCRLMLMAWGEQVPVHPDSAWAWVRRGTDVAEEAIRPGAQLQLELLAAGVLARAGLTDSARAVLDRARRTAGAGATQYADTGLRLEAGVHLLLGDTGLARSIVEARLERRSDARAELARSRILAPLFDGPTSR